MPMSNARDSTTRWQPTARITAIAIAGLGAILFFSVSFSRSRTILVLDACFENVNGLREGAEVQFAGVQVGNVSSVRAHPDDKQCPAKVEMAIAPGYDLKIPRDSVVTVNTAGILGAAYLNIDSRNAYGPAAKNHDVLKAKSPPSVSAAEAAGADADH